MRLSGNKAMVTYVNLPKDGNACVAGLEDGSICIWDLKNGKLTGGFSRNSYYISYVEGNPIVFIRQTSGTAMVWEKPYRRCSYVLEGRKFPVTQISFSKQASLCVVCHVDDVAEIWDLSKKSKKPSAANNICPSLMTESFFVGRRRMEPSGIKKTKKRKLYGRVLSASSESALGIIGYLNLKMSANWNSSTRRIKNITRTPSTI